MILAETDRIGAQDLGIEAAAGPRPPGEWEGKDFRFCFPPQGVSLEAAERELLLAALRRAHWVQKEAARLLGITKRAIHYKIEKHGITHPSWTKNRPPEPGGD